MFWACPLRGRHLTGFASLRASHPYGPSRRLTQKLSHQGKPIPIGPSQTGHKPTQARATILLPKHCTDVARNVSAPTGRPLCGCPIIAGAPTRGAPTAFYFLFFIFRFLQSPVGAICHAYGIQLNFYSVFLPIYQAYGISFYRHAQVILPKNQL